MCKKSWLLLGLVALSVLVLFSACGPNGSGTATFTVTGTVLEEGTAAPLAGAEVTIGNVSSTTNAQGQFSVDQAEEGSAVITAELDGYSDYSASVNVTANLDLPDPIYLSTDAPPLDFSSLNLQSGGVALEDGDEVDDTLVQISGNVNDFLANAGVGSLDTAITITQLQALVNGAIYTVPLTNGNFDYQLPVQPGQNMIQLRVWTNTGHARSSQITTVYVTLDRMDLRIVLTWDQANDVDLHLFQRTQAEGNVQDDHDGPAWSGVDSTDRHVSYYNKIATDFGAPGNPAEHAFLDVDDTSGYGPETIVLQEAVPADYHIWLHMYAARGYDTTSQVRVFVDSGLDSYQERSFTIDMTDEENWSVYYVTTVRVAADGSKSFVTVPPSEMNATSAAEAVFMEK